MTVTVERRNDKKKEDGLIHDEDELMETFRIYGDSFRDANNDLWMIVEAGGEKHMMCLTDNEFTVIDFMDADEHVLFPMKEIDVKMLLIEEEENQ